MDRKEFWCRTFLAVVQRVGHNTSASEFADKALDKYDAKWETTATPKPDKRHRCMFAAAPIPGGPAYRCKLDEGHDGAHDLLFGDPWQKFAFDPGD